MGTKLFSAVGTNFEGVPPIASIPRTPALRNTSHSLTRQGFLLYKDPQGP